MQENQPPTLALLDYAEVLTGTDVIEGDLADRLAAYFKAAPVFGEHLALLREVLQDIGMEESAFNSYYVAALHHGAVDLLQAGENFCPHPDPREGTWLLSNGAIFSLREVKSLLRLVEAREGRGVQGLGGVEGKLVGMLLKHGKDDDEEDED